MCLDGSQELEAGAKACHDGRNFLLAGWWPDGVLTKTMSRIVILVLRVRLNVTMHA